MRQYLRFRTNVPADDAATLFGVLLRENDVAVELLRTDNPGRVCYKDRFQVAAIP